MSGTRLEQVVRYVSAAGDGESWWIRLEQERADETLTVEEAAELIDTLYKTDPCSRGGPDASSDEEPPADPPREDYDDLAAEVMGDACAEASHWIAHVRVYRSHQKPDYVLRSATAEELSTETGLRESVRQVIENAGNSVDLDYPYAGDLVLPPGVSGEVRGSTLNLSRPAGRLVARYTTVYDRVALRVPVPEKAGRNESEEEAARRAALDAAGLIAFWNRLAHAIVLEPPPQDEETDAAEIADLCRASAKHRPGSGGGCWERLSHYSLCRCDESPAPDSEWDEEVGADCPEGVKAGTFLGSRRVMDGYTGCEGEEDELRDPEYYRKTCCKNPPPKSHLPVCREMRAVYRGGAPIEGGADSWRERYGEDVVLTAVSPPDGVCGKEITKWHDEQRNCCDDIIPMWPDPENPTEIQPGQTVWVGVRDGRHPGRYEWTAHGGLVFVNSGTNRLVTAGPGMVRVATRDNVCPSPRIEVDDGCDVVRMTFSSPGGEPVFLSLEDMAANPETRFSLAASGGVPPYMWMAVDIDMLGYSADGATAMFQTRARDAWCVATITVTDQCGQTATCSVRNAQRGRWRTVPFDPCVPLVAAPLVSTSYTPPGNTGWTQPRNGIRMDTYVDSKGTTSRLKCPVGNAVATNMDVMFRRGCERWMPRWTLVSCDDGVCVKIGTGTPAIQYFSSYILSAEKWLCG